MKYQPSTLPPCRQHEALPVSRPIPADMVIKMGRAAYGDEWQAPLAWYRREDAAEVGKGRGTIVGMRQPAYSFELAGSGDRGSPAVFRTLEGWRKVVIFANRPPVVR